MRRLESLEAWRAARQLAAMAYRLTLEPPLSRHFSLADQIRRAAPSVAANVAEGYGLATSRSLFVVFASPSAQPWSFGRTSRDRKSTRLNSSHVKISYA